MQDSQNSFTNGEKYEAYVKATNEKILLAKYLTEEFYLRNLPIIPGITIKPKRILDLGCGTGSNLKVLRELFPEHELIAIDRSPHQLEKARNMPAEYELTAFEDFRDKKFDFILASHVLQYIDTDPKKFILKIKEMLNSEGEAWIIQQTKKGMYEIISTVKEQLTNPRFKNWLTFEDYAKIMDELGIKYKTHILESSFDGIDFKNPTREQKKRLEFMLCLDNLSSQKNIPLMEKLGELETRMRICHPNGIIKMRRS